jgi:peroxiredoxin
LYARIGGLSAIDRSASRRVPAKNKAALCGWTAFSTLFSSVGQQEESNMRKILEHSRAQLASLLAVMLIVPSAWGSPPSARIEHPEPPAADPSKADAGKADSASGASAKDGSDKAKVGDASASNAVAAAPERPAETVLGVADNVAGVPAKKSDGTKPPTTKPSTTKSSTTKSSTTKSSAPAVADAQSIVVDVPADSLAEAKPAPAKSKSIVQIGDQAPDLRLSNVDGRVISLSDLRGKVVLIQFWATWCEPCKRAIPVLNDIDAQFDDSEVVVLAISVDPSPAKVAAFAKRNGIRQTVLVRGGAVIRKFGLGEIPSMVVVGRDGAITKTLVGLPADGGREVMAAIQSALKK